MVSDSISSRLIALDLYDGAYGPTLRIDIPSRELLESLKRVFRSLAQSKASLVHLAKVDFVRGGNVATLDLVLNEQSKKSRAKTLHLEDGSPGAAKFVWKQPADRWLDCFDLLDGFGEQPGHQYLTSERIDDALVEAAYLEC